MQYTIEFPQEETPIIDSLENLTGHLYQQYARVGEIISAKVKTYVSDIYFADEPEAAADEAIADCLRTLEGEAEDNWTMLSPELRKQEMIQMIRWIDEKLTI